MVNDVSMSLSLVSGLSAPAGLWSVYVSVTVSPRSTGSGPLSLTSSGMVISVRKIPLFASVSLRNGGDASNSLLL